MWVSRVQASIPRTALQLLPVAGIELQATRLEHSVGNDQRSKAQGW